MSTKDIVLAIVINAIWVVPLVHGVFISSFINWCKNNAKEKQLRRIYGNRLKCMNCKYCKRFLYRPFYYSLQCASYLPSYCKKFRQPLPHEMNTICIARNPEMAERINTTTMYREDNIFKP